jgi:hypothetical protein
VQREIEHTAALAEHRGDLNTKIKALYALGRMLWLENRLSGEAKDLTSDEEALSVYEDWQKRRLEGARTLREAALEAAGTFCLQGESGGGPVPRQAQDSSNARDQHCLRRFSESS